MSEKEQKVLIIEALDHFRTHKTSTKNCVLRYIGELAGEDDDYITLRYSDVYFDDEKDSEKFIKIMKKCIISKVGFKSTGGMAKKDGN